MHLRVPPADERLSHGAELPRPRGAAREAGTVPLAGDGPGRRSRRLRRGARKSGSSHPTDRPRIQPRPLAVPLRARRGGVRRCRRRGAALVAAWRGAGRGTDGDGRGRGAQRETER